MSRWALVKGIFRKVMIRLGYYSKPKFLIIGAQKGGTVALFNYLAAHPAIVPASKKEINFFDQDILYNRGFDWYHSHFPLPHRLKPRGITFEATPEYLYYPVVPERLFSYHPYLKLIVLLRNPVERAFSAWNMFRNMSKPNPKFEKILQQFRQNYDEPIADGLTELLSSEQICDFTKAMEHEIAQFSSDNTKLEPSFIRRGIYYDQILRYFEYFDRNQMLIIDSQMLKVNPSLVLREVVSFLELSDQNWGQTNFPLFHVGKYETRMPEKARLILNEFYKPYNEQLYELLGRNFGW